jgi:hypothetical protein
MKKLVVAALVLGIGGWFAYAKVLRAPKRACSHMRDLCGDHEDNDCSEFFDAIKNNASSEEADKTAQCVLDAKTCPEAAGCMAGGGIKLGVGAARSFLDGLQKATK